MRDPAPAGKGQYTSVYYYPGFHKAKLMIDQDAVKEHDIHITTDEWLTLARYGTDNPVPLYIPGGDVQGDDFTIEARMKNDLSALGCDLPEWNNPGCEIAGKKARISVNESLAREVSYKKSAGRVIGLHFLFFGCGSVDYVRLETSDGTVVFEDDFMKMR